jgi:hypothetical protein
MARHPTPNTTSDKTLSRRILVNIKRDMTEITPRVIWAHEKPLLEPSTRRATDRWTSPRWTRATAPSRRPTCWSTTRPWRSRRGRRVAGARVRVHRQPEAEYQRLFDVYGRMPDENVLVVEKVYGRFQGGSFARLMGSPELDDLPEAQLRALVLDYGYAPEPHKDACAGREERDVGEAQGAVRHGPRGAGEDGAGSRRRTGLKEPTC